MQSWLSSGADNFTLAWVLIAKHVAAQAVHGRRDSRHVVIQSIIGEQALALCTLEYGPSQFSARCWFEY